MRRLDKWEKRRTMLRYAHDPMQNGAVSREAYAAKSYTTPGRKRETWGCKRCVKAQEKLHRLRARYSGEARQRWINGRNTEPCCNVRVVQCGTALPNARAYAAKSYTTPGRKRETWGCKRCVKAQKKLHRFRARHMRQRRGDATWFPYVAVRYAPALASECTGGAQRLRIFGQNIGGEGVKEPKGYGCSRSFNPQKRICPLKSAPGLAIMQGYVSKFFEKPFRHVPAISTCTILAWRGQACGYTACTDKTARSCRFHL